MCVLTAIGSLINSWPSTRKARLFAAAGAADGDLLAFGMGRLVKAFTNAGLHKGTLLRPTATKCSRSR